VIVFRLSLVSVDSTICTQSYMIANDVHGLASGQKPSQVKSKVLAWSWLWPGLDFLKAKANDPGHGFEHYFLNNYHQL
jgi:hypothetical protein